MNNNVVNNKAAGSSTRPIAVTGATGFVGQAVLDQAASAHRSVRALVRREQAPRAGVSWLRGDLADRGALADLVDRAEAVLHIAGVVNTPDPIGFHTGNVAGTKLLLQAAQDAGVRRFVFVSSIAAREPDLSLYGQSKRDAESLVRTSGLDWTIVRPPTIYGPRDQEVLELFRAAKKGIVPMPPKGGRSSIIHVEDLARLLLALSRDNSPLLSNAATPHISTPNTGSPNIGTPDTSTINKTFEPDDGKISGWSHHELAQAIGAAVGRKVWTPHLPAGLMHLVARLDRTLRGDRAKLTPDRVGYMVHPDWVCAAQRTPPAQLWQPHIKTAEGLAATANWYREAGWL